MVQDLTRHAVEMDDAGTALGGVAADMGAGQPQRLAQELDQQGAASTSPVTALPFTVMETVGMAFLLNIGAEGLVFDRRKPRQRRSGEIAPFLPELAVWNPTI